MKTTRYISKSESDSWSFELSFTGGTEAGEGNPPDTDVRIRLLSKVNTMYFDSPWQIEWERILGDHAMPTGAWNGFHLVEVVNNLIFYATSNHVTCLSPKTGEELWAVCTGNTSVYDLLVSKNGDSLIVYNSYYGFKSTEGKGNIVKLSLDGKTLWRAELPSEKDMYANPPRYRNSMLLASTWECFSCVLSEESGCVLDKTFTK